VWSHSPTHYLSTNLGQDGVPLSYIIHENNQADCEEEEEEDFDFTQLSIKCAPLIGVFYKTDTSKLHQLSDPLICAGRGCRYLDQAYREKAKRSAQFQRPSGSPRWRGEQVSQDQGS
jgi:hypothetical protein